MRLYFSIVIFCGSVFGLINAAYISEDGIGNDILSFGDKFQTVVVADVNNLTSIYNTLANPTDIPKVFAEIPHLFHQLNWTYTLFNDAVVVIKHELYQTTQNENGYHGAAIRVSDGFIMENVRLLDDTHNSLNSIVSILRGLIGNVPSLIKSFKAIKVVHGNAEIPNQLVGTLFSTLNQLGGLNGLVSKFLGELSNETEIFIHHHRHLLRRSHILEPIKQYANIMGILYKICGLLHKYFEAFLLKENVDSLGAEHFSVNLKGQLNTIDTVLHQIIEMYKETRHSNYVILNYLRKNGQPINYRNRPFRTMYSQDFTGNPVAATQPPPNVVSPIIAPQISPYVYGAQTQPEPQIYNGEYDQETMPELKASTGNSNPYIQVNF